MLWLLLAGLCLTLGEHIGKILSGSFDIWKGHLEVLIYGRARRYVEDVPIEGVVYSIDIQMSIKQVYHERTKHIDMKFHFTREETTWGYVKMVKVTTNHNMSDMITKVFSVVWI